ncbi:MAG TPA: hypothetical protein PK640_17980, partial [Verrucomicrobiota bacterium]|nr:hypothetical protein [Verrucomicrobiota bacterium]
LPCEVAHPASASAINPASTSIAPRLRPGLHRFWGAGLHRFAHSGLRAGTARGLRNRFVMLSFVSDRTVGG